MLENMIGVCHPGDCLDGLASLPDKSVDHTITDPPYETSVHEGQIQARREERGRHLESITPVPGLSFEPLSDAAREKYAAQIARVTKGWAIVFCQAEAVGKWRLALEVAGAKYKRAALWVKPNAMPQFSGDRPGQGYEQFVCAWCSDGRSVWNAGGKVGNYFHPIPRGENRYHETQKPMGLMAEIIQDFTSPGDVILDPFAGSGTTLLAARRLERRFIGFEKNPEYCKISNERLSDPLFMPERRRASQLSFL